MENKNKFLLCFNSKIPSSWETYFKTSLENKLTFHLISKHQVAVKYSCFSFEDEFTLVRHWKHPLYPVKMWVGWLLVPEFFFTKFSITTNYRQSDDASVLHQCWPKIRDSSEKEKKELKKHPLKSAKFLISCKLCLHLEVNHHWIPYDREREICLNKIWRSGTDTNFCRGYYNCEKPHSTMPWLIRKNRRWHCDVNVN